MLAQALDKETNTVNRKIAEQGVAASRRIDGFTKDLLLYGMIMSGGAHAM